jgi:predicted membrane-bound mannosyltransferase
MELSVQARQTEGRQSPAPESADGSLNIPATTQQALQVTEASRETWESGTDDPAESGVSEPGRAQDGRFVPDRLRIGRSVSYEALAYLIIIFAAIVSRFWDLGSKTLHHDESLHTYYSWQYATGGGYVHDPLMHGPFLFHANALVYLLFGDTDATSRYMPALFGVILVGLPYLLRGARHLGRWGALSASFFLLISPTILYQSRYIRHDIYTIAGTLLLFICIVRYIERPQRRWLVTGAATIAFLLTNHEIIFAILAIFGGYLYGAVFVEYFRAWRRFAPRLATILVAAHVIFAALGIVLYLVVPESRRAELLDIPWNNPTREQERDYYATVLTNPLVIGFLVLLGLFLISLYFLSREAKRLDLDILANVLTPEEGSGTVSHAVRVAWRDKTGLLAAVTAALVIFVPLYTSMFQNMNGLRSSTIATDGTLLYWLGQHDYQRGEQPWFYFLLLMPQYEYLAVLLGGFMVAVAGIRAVGSLFGRSPGPNLFFRLFLAVWFVLIFAGLSFAGEKMPWLVVHIALPAILLAAVLTGVAIEWVTQHRNTLMGTGTPARLPVMNRRDWGLTAVLLIVGGAWFWRAANLSYGEFVPEGTPNRGGWQRTVTEFGADNWWRLAVPWILVIGLLVAWTVWRGGRRAALSAIAAVILGLSIMQVHAGWRMSYYEADVPKDMMIYTQTSPDVSRIMDELDELSAQLTGGPHLSVWYDSDVSWPFQWYLRDYTQKRFIGSTLSGPPEDAAVVLLGGSGTTAEFMEGYTGQEYVLRWWFPEDTYRHFAIAPEINPGRSAWGSSEDPHGPIDVVRSIGDTLENQTNIDDQLRLYRLVIYRDLDGSIGQTNFRIFIRNDLLPLYDSIRYGS